MSNRLFIETSALTADTMSGIGNTLLAILHEWKKSQPMKNFEIVLLVPFDKRRKLASYNLGFTIKTIPIPDKALRGLRRFNLLPKLDRFIGKGTYLFPNYWNWPLKHSRSLTYVYDVSFLIDDSYTEPKNRAFLARNVPIWLRRADKIITISQHAKTEIMKYYQVESRKIDVVYNGVDTDLFIHSSAQRIQNVKRKYDIEQEYLLFVGNIEPRKNISRLVAAYRQLPKSLTKKYQLFIVGGYGWNNEQIKRDIEMAVQDGFNVQKNKTFVVTEDLPALYSGAVALVHPALYEGFGMTPLEAMACDVPVIVSDTSSLPEVVGDAGLYVDAQNVEDISAKIRGLLEEPRERKRLVQAGRARMQKFTWKQTVDGLTKSIEGLMNE